MVNNCNLLHLYSIMRVDDRHITMYKHKLIRQLVLDLSIITIHLD